MKRGNTDTIEEESRKKRRVDSADDPFDPFDSVPDEILDMVLKKCPQRDHSKWLTVFGTVCSRWRRMSKLYVQELVVKNPSVYVLGEVIPSLPNVYALELQKPLPKDLNSLKRIRGLAYLEFTCPRKMTDQELEERAHSFKLIGQLSQLESLILHGPTSDEDIWRLSSLVDLESLELDCEGVTGESVQLLQHFTALRHLDIPWAWNVGPALANLTNLSSLHARGCDGIHSLEGLEDLVNLKHADLGEVEPAHLGHIGAWTNLEILSINAVTAHESVTRWTSLKKLKLLDMSYSEITPQLLRTLISCTSLQSIYFEEGLWLDWDLVHEDLLVNISRLTNLYALGDIKHHPVFDSPVSRLPASLTQLEIISDNGQMREQFFANISHLTNLKSLRFSYTQGGKHALNSAIIEGFASFTGLTELIIRNERYNDEFYPIYREMVRMTGPNAAVFLDQYANHTSSFPNVSFAAFSSLTNLRKLQVDLDPFFEAQVLALTALTNLTDVQFGKYFTTIDFNQLLGRPAPPETEHFIIHELMDEDHDDTDD